MSSLAAESGSAYIDQPHYNFYVQHPVYVMEKGYTIPNQYLQPWENREEVLKGLLEKIIGAEKTDVPVPEIELAVD